MLALFLAAAIAWDTHCGGVGHKVVESQAFESAAISWLAGGSVRIRVSADGVVQVDRRAFGLHVAIRRGHQRPRRGLFAVDTNRTADGPQGEGVHATNPERVTICGSFRGDQAA